MTHPKMANTCDFYTYTNNEIKLREEKGKDSTELAKDLSIHTVEYKKQQKKLSDAENDCLTDTPHSEWRTVCIDLQQTLPCPK